MTNKHSLIIIAAFLVGASISLLTLLPTHQSATTPTSSGKALVGGPFELTDHTGKRVTDRDFRGKFMLIYFGYSYCPDVCPTELQVISAALDQLGTKAKSIAPLFITIDPQRDTPEQLAQYVTHFHPNMIGLTGSSEDIEKTAKTFRVFYAKATSSPNASEQPTDYLMDHSNLILLMDKDGEFLTHFTHQTDPHKLAREIAKLLT